MVRMRLDYLKWKEKQKEKKSDERNMNRFAREKSKWQRQARRWGHKHPER